MHIISDPYKDVKTNGKAAGGYEWWYFDAMDPETGYSFVIIFYEGNPFSRRYNHELCDGNRENVRPEHYPAVSISVYKGDKTVYYSFTEYEEKKALFGSETPNLKVGRHSMIGEAGEGELTYTIHLEEELPSGDAIRADIRFAGKPMEFSMEGERERDNARGHTWNLLQPISLVNASINFRGGRKIDFEGVGYHDHNSGHEPMAMKFEEWYWGRFHFPGTTFVYYIMNGNDGTQYLGWLIGNELENLEYTFSGAELSDYSRSVFALETARKIKFEGGGHQLHIQQSESVDNGPFYRRFLSEAFLRKDDGTLLRSTGFSEYLKPDRIHHPLFRPLVNMRIRYRAEKPHWVQKIPRLYRWTWGNQWE